MFMFLDCVFFHRGRGEGRGAHNGHGGNHNGGRGRVRPADEPVRPMAFGRMRDLLAKPEDVILLEINDKGFKVIRELSLFRP